MNEFQVFRRLVKKYPSYGGAIIREFLLPFFERKYSLKDTLEDFASQPGVDKEYVLGLLEKVK